METLNPDVAAAERRVREVKTALGRLEAQRRERDAAIDATYTAP